MKIRGLFVTMSTGLRKAGETMNRKEDYIAVFDSGVGGISVLRHLVALMPGERFIYYGDSANAPYGTRSTAQVRRLTLAAAAKLVEQYPLKALVIACNTATAAAISDLRQTYPDLIVIGIEPALKLAWDRFPGGNIGVMATEVTLREEKFDSLLHRFDHGDRVVKISAPGLVELVEAGQCDTQQTEALLRPILEPWRGKLDVLVLGCTHYPFAANAIRRILGDGIELVDGGEGTARETRRRLAQRDLLTRETAGAVEITGSAEDSGMGVLARQLLERE